MRKSFCALGFFVIVSLSITSCLCQESRETAEQKLLKKFRRALFVDEMSRISTCYHPDVRADINDAFDESVFARIDTKKAGRNIFEGEVEHDVYISQLPKARRSFVVPKGKISKYKMIFSGSASLPVFIIYDGKKAWMLP